VCVEKIIGNCQFVFRCIDHDGSHIVYWSDCGGRIVRGREVQIARNVRGEGSADCKKCKGEGSADCKKCKGGGKCRLQ